MFPQIPENLSELSSADLRSLAAEIRTAAQAVLAKGPSPEELAQVREYRAHLATIVAAANAKDEAADLQTAFADDELAERKTTRRSTTDKDANAARDEGGDEAGEVEPAIEGGEVNAPVAGQPGAPEHVERGEPQPVQRARTVPTEGGQDLAARGGVAVRTGVGVVSQVDGEGGGRVTPGHLLARDGVNGKRPGENFDSWTELSQALLDKANGVRANTSEKFQVGYVPGRFAPDRVLDENPIFNLAKFDEAELMAAMCAPLEPQYDLACWNTTRRPVRNSMAGYAAPRGGATIYPSPTLQSITTGVGVWTAANDANPSATKLACQTIACATPVEYRIYGVYRCITIKNMLAMTFPELVEAYLNRLAAAHARLAEVQLLEAMATGATSLNTLTLGYNATVSITTTILNYLALYQESQRWDVPTMDAWMPRWVLFAIKADLMRRRNTSGDVLRAPSDAEVAALFRDVGVEPHFWLDTPSWATPVPSLAVSGLLGQFPRNVEMLVAPRGKFAVMDRGELAIGVTGNNLYRDNTSNSRNEFTFFFENFEGVVNTDSCPAHILQIDNLCFNGQQIADLIMNCEGGDEAGSAS
jgi:hypothetical protein